MVLYIVGIGIVLGFVVLLWRQHKTNGGWQREASFLMDLVALSATALIVGVLVITQLGSIEQITSGSDKSGSDVMRVEQNLTSVSVESTAISQEVSQSNPVSETVTLMVEEEALATRENNNPEPTNDFEATSTPSPTVSTQVKKSPTSTPKATYKATSTPKVTTQKTKTPKGTPTSTIYTIKNGDIFSVIAKNFDLSIEELEAANPTINPERLTIGDELIIPIPQELQEDDQEDETDKTDDSDNQIEKTKTATPTPTKASGTYVIQGGDTLSKIAERFNVTIDDILRANPTLNPDKLKLDQEIIIPPPSTNNNNSSSTSASKQYMVREGDTFGLIAKRFNLSQEELQRLNPNVNPDRLSIGQVIRIQ